MDAMNDERQAFEPTAEQVEALADELRNTHGIQGDVEEVIAVVWQAARAASPVQQPVAWIDPADFVTLKMDGWCVVHAAQCDSGTEHCADVPLYTAQPPQPPQGAQQEPLTEIRLTELWDGQRKHHGGEPIKLAHAEFARAIERAHGIE
jgi:hypothetical protein